MESYLRLTCAIAVLAGCSGARDTCIVASIKYGGTSTGRVFLVGGPLYADRSKPPPVFTSSGNMGPFRSEFDSVAAAGPTRTCWSKGELLFPVEYTAWIDVGAQYPDGCTPTLACAPYLGDPVGGAMISIVRAGEDNDVVIVIADP